MNIDKVLTTLGVGFITLLVCILFLELVFRLYAHMTKPTPVEQEHANALRMGVALLLQGLTPEQRQAVEFYAWADRTSWLKVVRSRDMDEARMLQMQKIIARGSEA